MDWLYLALGVGVIVVVLGWLAGKFFRPVNQEQKQQTPIESLIESKFSEAISIMQSGQIWEAEQVMKSLVESVTTESGEDSSERAMALYRYASLLIAMDDLTRAIALLREACDIAKANETLDQQLLTYQMNLGLTLSQNGVHQEAIEVLEENLKFREQFFGKRHSGYAFGLNALAEALITAKQSKVTLPLINESIKIDLASMNPNIIDGIALKAVILEMLGKEEIFPDWSKLPEEGQLQVLDHAHGMSRTHPPGILLGLYQKLRPLFESRKQQDPQKLIEVDVAISNFARQVEDHIARIEAFQRIFQVIGEEHPESINTLLGLAMAYAEADAISQADETYAYAVQIANRTETPELQAQVFRNYAIHLAETGCDEQAETMHQRAVECARESNREELLGRTLCAYGIFLQHTGQTENVIPLLEESLLYLPQSHPDALCSESHLKAVRLGESCPCSETNTESYVEFLKKLVIDRAPEGLVDQISYDESDLESPVSVSVTREPTEEESKQLFDAIQNALAEIRMSSSKAFYTE